MIDITQVGAHPHRESDGQWQLHIGIYLPQITPAKGYQLKVRIIHQQDQFIRAIPPLDFDLHWQDASTYDLWQTQIAIAPVANTHFGDEGTYLYRFQLLRHGQPVVFWFSDPFGHHSGQGTFSSFTLVADASPFNWTDNAFQVPHIDNTVVYELHTGEFNRSFAGLVNQLDYLWELGVNVLEIMPFTNVKESAEWGYTPLGYFAPDERYGGALGLKDLVNQCHARGMAVILDAVYAHAHPEFPYNLVYQATGEANPMMGYFEGEFFQDAPGTDYNKAFTREYFLALNRYWLEEYHLDGFRYDYIPGMYDGPTGNGYAQLTYATYQLSKNLTRFQDAEGHSRIIQCAEHLPDPQGIIRQTYSSCCWQNQLKDKAVDSATWNYIDPSFAFLLDPQTQGYSSEYQNTATGDSFPVAPFQYIASHDHASFLTRIAPSGLKDLIGQNYGDRSQFYRVQPYVIALYIGKGIPMLWQGQEIGENWGMPSWGVGRNLLERPVHWEYFYDPYGRALVRLHRILGAMRRQFRALSSRGTFYYYNESQHYSQQVIVIRREAAAENTLLAETLMIAINFSGSDKEVWIPFPTPGIWKEQLDKDEANSKPDIHISSANTWQAVSVPSYYGSIYSLELA